MIVDDEHPVRQLLARAGRPALVLHDEAAAELARALVQDVDGAVRLHRVGRPVPEAPRRWPLVVVVVAHGGSLRRSVSVLPHLGRSRLIAWLLADADEPALVAPRPEWPVVGAVHGRLLSCGGALTTLRADGPAPVRDVLAEVSRMLGPPVSSFGGPVIATVIDDPQQAPPADPSMTVGPAPAAAVLRDDRWPPDVVLAPAAEGTQALPVHDLTGRAPALVSDPELLAGPLDEGILNPAGFRRQATRGEVSLSVAADGRLRLAGSDFDPRLLTGGVTPDLVTALRPHLGVRVAWGSPTPSAQVTAVAALAMAGIPVVVAEDRAPWPRLGAALSAALRTSPDLHEALAREEHSVELRRAALRDHSTLAWRERLSVTAGLPWRRFPTCSVILPLTTAGGVPTTLERLAPQAGSDVEVVVATAGTQPDAGTLRGGAEDRVTVVRVAPHASREELLEAALAAASGDLVATLTPGDWYGSDVVADLLWARHYSGAAAVGLPAEVVYDEQADRTLWRAVPVERFAVPAAAGAALIGRTDLLELRRSVAGPVDPTRLMGDVHAAGADVYTTHGLGHVALATRVGDPSRPSGSGPARYGSDDRRLEAQWGGFRPSRLLGVPPPGRSPTKESSA